ncbi:hypothetical protein ANCCAN_30319 [Ancylostoma caninum]|uniref:DRBM domain-containing protein n=1 Tax=Ancylostoma caninum TaxID=29170 RepID=A0A368EWA4_ANCCA|nr:hypothetical protein ANCCAN_30319 [Ancylostoma caninum]
MHLLVEWRHPRRSASTQNVPPWRIRWLTQCLLKIIFAKPGEQQRTPYVFPGEHSTEEGAKQQAARRAVLFLTS